VRDASEVRDLNRKQRNKMSVVKEGLEVSDVILQEGVHTFEHINDAVAEPVVYMMDRYGVGDLYASICAMEYAINKGARIINCSWGWYGDSSAIMGRLIRNHVPDVIWVASAGNDGYDNMVHPHYPSNYRYPNVLAVASAAPTGMLSWFSNFNPFYVDLATYGENITSTYLNNTCKTKSGTSFSNARATAMVTAQFCKNGFTTAGVLNVLKARATAMPTMPGMTVTGGIINPKSCQSPAAAREASDNDPEIIKTFAGKGTFMVYPNPATTILNVSWLGNEVPEASAQLHVLNSMGQLVLIQPFSDAIDISAPIKLPPKNAV
jgi:hypothetical protein